MKPHTPLLIYDVGSNFNSDEWSPSVSTLMHVMDIHGKQSDIELTLSELLKQFEKKSRSEFSDPVVEVNDRGTLRPS